MKKVKTTKKTKSTPVVSKPVQNSCCVNVWSWSIYAYWFIILFFIASTFYILGRSHEFTHPRTDMIVAEEVLAQAEDYVAKAKEKLVAGDMDAAIADLNTAIDSNATSDTYTLRGEVYMQIGDYQNALKDYDAALEKNAMNAVAFYDRYLLNARLENYEAALRDINNALAAQSKNPNDVLNLRDLYAKRGQLNLWLKNWEGAIADYTNSLARTEGSVSADVYAERAEAYTALGEYENAINDYTSAVRIISEQIQAATTQDMREEQSSDAMSYFEKSAALNLNIGNIDAAKTDLESALAIALALNDEESVSRIQSLLSGLN
jgi:tetratricopeptide (TPR) repeat protein